MSKSAPTRRWKVTEVPYRSGEYDPYSEWRYRGSHPVMRGAAAYRVVVRRVAGCERERALSASAPTRRRWKVTEVRYQIREFDPYSDDSQIYLGDIWNAAKRESRYRYRTMMRGAAACRLFRMPG